MPNGLIITPVKDSITNTLTAIKAIRSGRGSARHIVYNDFSTAETRKILEENADRYNYELINLEDITDTPSPNYTIVLQDAQSKAIEANVPLIIVESDVVVKKDTFQRMFTFISKHPKAGMVGAVTVDENANINFPYKKFKDLDDDYIDTKRSLSFCCTLLSIEFLNSYNFLEMDSSKDWYDTFISSKSLELGFKNYVMMNTPVLHRPHGSRPWKKLKYSNPLKYYVLKIIKGRDKI